MANELQNDIDTSFNQLYYCQMTIGNADITPENIITMSIREWVFDVVPRLYCIINDDGMLSEIFNMEDEIKISVLLAKTPEEDAMEFDFILHDFKFNLVADNKYSIVSFTGILDINNFYSNIRNRSFKNKSAKQVLSTIANESNLNFNIPTNFRTNDTMTWLQINKTNFDFVKHIKERSFKEDDMILCYCDINNNLNLTSLKTEINKQESKSAFYDQDNYTKFAFDNEEDEKTIWYNYYDYLNLNGMYNKINNYGIEYNYFDLNDNKSNSVKFNDSSFTEMTFKNKNNIENKTKLYNYGIQNNVYDNYEKARAQNDYYKMNFFGFSMALNINSLIDVKLMEIVDLVIPSMPSYGDENAVNYILSGKYLISGIVYSIGKGKLFKKQIILSRDGMNKSSYVETFNNK